MVQNPKGGGLSSSFGGSSQQLGGVKKTTDFLDKSTWGLSILLLALILISNLTINRQGNINSKALDTDIESSESLPNTSSDNVSEETTTIESLLSLIHI